MMESSLCICPIGLSHLPITVDAGGDLLSAGHSVASRQKAPPQVPSIPFWLEDFLDVIYNLGHGVSAVQQLSDAVLHDLPQQVDLFGVGELLHIAQIDGAPCRRISRQGRSSEPLSDLPGAGWSAVSGQNSAPVPDRGLPRAAGKPPLPFWQIP